MANGAGGLLGAITNPSQVDVLGSLDRGRKRQARDLAGDILGKGQLAGIGRLARLDPEQAINLAEAAGFSLDSKGQRENEFGITIAADKLIQAGLTQEAAQLLEQEITKIESFAGPTESTKKFRLTQDALLNGTNPEVLAGFHKFAQAITPETGDAFTLKAGETRFGPRGKVIARGEAETGPKAPDALLEGLSSPIRKKAKEAFLLAGGGKDGVKALNEAVKLGKETLQREDIPQILDSSFPNASPAERLQLEAAMAAAKTPESGLKQAETIRSEQRRLKKAQGFQQRSVQLLTGILDNPQLPDVLGSLEGAIDFRLFSDEEAGLITDIEEAGNILTAENLDLMTGVLSESDIKLLKSLSSGALNRKRTEKRFIADVTQLRDKLQSELVQTVDDTEQELAPAAPPAPPTQPSLPGGRRRERRKGAATPEQRTIRVQF